MEASESMDPSDRLRQLDAMMTHDISKRFDGQMSAASRAVRAKMLIVVATQDQMVNPHPALAFAEMLRNVPIRLESACGHLAPGCEAEQVNPVVRSALDTK